MHNKLQERFNRLEQAQQQLLKKLSTYPDAKLNTSPPGKWSVGYILAHLMTSERLMLIYMKKKSRGMATIGNSGMLEEVKMMLLKISQRLSFRYKAPVYVVEHTKELASLTDLTQRWQSTRQDLKTFLENTHDENLYKLIYKHPVAGRLNLLQALDFMLEHFHHHLPQINRLL